LAGYRLAIVLALMALCAVPMFASAAIPADPRVIITDPAGPCTPVGLRFNFNADGSGDGTQCFTNGSGVNWFNLDILVENSFSGALSCGGNAFLQCKVGTDHGIPDILFSGGTLASGMTFQVALVCDPNCFSPNGLFRAAANVPEPATFLLFGSGLAGSVLRQIRRKKRTNRLSLG